MAAPRWAKRSAGAVLGHYEDPILSRSLLLTATLCEAKCCAVLEPNEIQSVGLYSDLSSVGWSLLRQYVPYKEIFKTLLAQNAYCFYRGNWRKIANVTKINDHEWRHIIILSWQRVCFLLIDRSGWSVDMLIIYYLSMLYSKTLRKWIKAQAKLSSILADPDIISWIWITSCCRSH